MEKQTIGQFLSALRRSNGYTQQEVADKLGVSNKTVSCWERDAYLPDISVIPAIAELYGVTCDEILRAKRSPVQPELPQNEADAEKIRMNAEKAEKEASAIFDNMLARYENTQKIAVLSTVFATIAAVCAAVLTVALTNYQIAAFGIAVPISVLSFFILYLIQYRIDFAVPVEDRTLAVRKRMYLRKRAAFAFLIAVAAFFAPFCINFDYFSRCAVAGIAAAVLSLMVFYAVCLSRKRRHADFYPNGDPSFTSKDFKVYTAIFTVVLAFVVVFGTVVKIMPYGSFNRYITTYNVTLEFDYKSLKATLSARSLPSEYKEVSSRVSYNYAEYDYTVAKKDFDKRDLEGYYFHTVETDVLKDSYSVKIFYPVWHISFTETNGDGEKTTSTEPVTVFNDEYALSHITTTENGENYYVTILRYYDYEADKRSRDFEYIIACAAAGAVFVFIVYGTWKEICLARRRKEKESPSPQSDQL